MQKIFAKVGIFVVAIAAVVSLNAPTAVALTQDKWVFFGDSITRMTANPGPGSFSERVHALNPDVFPTQVNAGTSGLTTTRALKSFGRVLSSNSTAKYVVIALGTNDSNGDATRCYNSPTQFYNDYVKLVNMTLNAGKIPVVPVFPSSGSKFCGPIYRDEILRLWQNFPQVVQGPDLWTYFQVGPDGTTATKTDQQKAWFPEGDVHPSSSGIDEYRQVWANDMVQKLYPVIP